MIELQAELLPQTQTTFFDSFQTWRSTQRESGLLPVIGITGSRGKTTVVRLLDSILVRAGLQTATRTNVSVELRNRRQRGEIAPWTRALSELRLGTLDVAIEEIDWLSVHTMGLSSSSYPLFGITNVCANRDACLIQGEAKRAIASVPTVFDAVHPSGSLVINGDDLEVSREELQHDRATVFVGMSRESPGLRAHLEAGGSAGWTDNGHLIAGNEREQVVVAQVADLRFALHGRAGFQLHNALMAASIASQIGIPPDVIRDALAAFDSIDTWMPESFQVIDFDGVSVVVDRPNPSWFLRPILRALRDVGANRVITVVGKLGGIPSSDLPEVGRLLGRVSSLFVSHSEGDEPERSASVKHGAAMNNVPPVIVHTTSEGRALGRALEIARPGDLVLVLADRPAPLSRTLRRNVHRKLAQSMSLV